MNLLQLSLRLLLLSGICSGHFNCLTWKSDNIDFSLIFRVNNFSLPVTFIDPSGKEQAQCIFNSSNTDCISHHKNGSVLADIQRQQIIFVIKGFNRLNVNGTWACTDGINRFTTVVSTDKGLLESTDVYIDGSIQSGKKVRLKCFSCTVPQWEFAEFFINNRSVDTIRCIPETMQCFHSEGICHTNTCACSTSGNEFTRIFPIDIDGKNITFSCQMKFVDDIVLSRFLKIATVSFHGKGFTNLPQITEITKAAELDKNDDRKDKEIETAVTTTKIDADKEQSEVWFMTAVLIAFFLTGFAGIFFYKIRKKKKDDAVTHLREKESLPPGNKGTFVEEPVTLPLIENTDDALTRLREKERLPPEPTSWIEPLKTGSFSENLKDNSYMCNWCSINNRKTTAHGWCIDCDEFLCPECYKIHNSTRLGKDHDVLVTKMLPHYFSFPCKIHQTEQLSRCDDSLFCEVCLGEIKQFKRLELAGAISDTIENSQAYNDFIKTLVWCKNELDLLATHRKKHVESDKRDARRIKTDLDAIHERTEYQNQDDIPADIVKTSDLIVENMKDETEDVIQSFNELEYSFNFVKNNGLSKELLLFIHFHKILLNKTAKTIEKLIENYKNVNSKMVQFANVSSFPIKKNPGCFVSRSEQQAQVPVRKTGNPIEILEITTEIGKLCFEGNINSKEDKFYVVKNVNVS